MSQDGDDKDKAVDDKPAPAKADDAAKAKADEPEAKAKADEPKPAAKADEPEPPAKADEPEPAAKADEPPAKADVPKAAAKADEKPAPKADEPKAAAKTEEKAAAKAEKAAVPEKPVVAKAVEPPAKDGVVRRRNEVPPTRKNEVFREPAKKPATQLVPLKVPVSALVGFAVVVTGALWAYFTYDVGLVVLDREILIDPGPPAALDIYVRKNPIPFSTTLVNTLLAFAPMVVGMAVFATGLRDGKDARIDAKIHVPIFVPVGFILLVFGGMLMFLGHESGLLATTIDHVLAGLPIVAGVAVFCMGLQKLHRIDKPPPDPNEPPIRQSYHDMMNPVVTYPDGKFSSVLRSADDGLGRAEQVLLVTLLASVTFIAATHALFDKIANIAPFGHFKDDAIRAGTFAMALIGGAFATHQVRHLAMDLITRGLPPRGRLFLKVVISLFTIGVIVLLVRSGFHSIWKEYEFNQEPKLITPVRVAYLIPIGGGLIILHTILHTLIDIDYLARGKTPPERQRSGH